MAKTRTPAKKFTGRKLSRRTRIRLGDRARFFEHAYAKFFPYVFGAAEEILRVEGIRNARTIVIGQAMRPLFDSIRAINEVRQMCPRKNIRYYVLPSQNGERINEAILEITKEQLLKHRIVSGKQNKYYIVDYVQEGLSMDALVRAIHELNPAAEVFLMKPPSRDFAAAIQLVESFARPTVKDITGRISENPNQHPRDFYLFFQRHLQDYIDEVKKGRKPITPEEALERALRFA